MGLFDKFKKKETKKSSLTGDPLQDMARGTVELIKLIKEHYLPQIEGQISNPAAANMMKQAFKLNSDEQLKAFLLVKVLERDFNKVDPGNIGVITAFKDVLGLDTFESVEIIKKANNAPL